MEQHRTSTGTVSRARVPGVPTDASSLDSLRSGSRREITQRRPTAPTRARVQGVQATEEPPGFSPINLSSTESRSSSRIAHESGHAGFQRGSKARSPTTTSPARSSVTQSTTNAEHRLVTPDRVEPHLVSEIITRNDKIRRILQMVNWTKVRGDTVQEVATFRDSEDAEIKFQEFESFIRAESKNLDLPDGYKPFERVLIQGSKAGSKPRPYIRFTDFCTEEDVRRYHAALSKRKVKCQYHPPLRLCYEIQRVEFHAANSAIHVKGDLGETLCGKIALIEDGSTRRLVTIGGVLKIDNKLYAMTAAHKPTSENRLQPPSGSEPSVGSSVEGLEYDDDIESALICGGPSTTSEDVQQRRGGGQNVQSYTVPESAPLRFQRSSMSADDCSLHLIDDPLLALPNSFPGIDGVTRYMTGPVTQPVSGPTHAWLLAGASGHRVVQVIPGIVSFPLPSGNWVSAWKVALNHHPFQYSASNSSSALQHGDSGSWVVNRLNGNVFGHVIASTDSTAFLIPLIHTLDSISRQAKLKCTGDVPALPPAFDMLADIAHAYYEESGKIDHDQARLFASRALTSSTRSCSPTSRAVPIVDSFLKSHQDSPMIMKLLQNLLILTGADIKGNLASIYRDQSSDSLSKVIDDSAPVEVAEAAIRNLTISLGLPTEIPSIHGTPMGRRLLLLGGTLPESKEQSNHEDPHSQPTLAHTMSTDARLYWPLSTTKRKDRGVDDEPEIESPSPGPSHLVHQDRRHPALDETKYPSSSAIMRTARPAYIPPLLPFKLPFKGRRKRICGLPALACAGNGYHVNDFSDSDSKFNGYPRCYIK